MAATKKTRTKKAKQTKPKNAQAQFYHSVFDLIAQRGWFSLTLPDIAKATRISLAELLQTYPDKVSILSSFGRYMDTQLAQGTVESTEPLKDKLFDMVMRRFDALAPYRAGVVRLMEELQSHPISAAMLCLETLYGFNRSMALMLEMAGISTSHPRAILGVIGLKIVYLSTLRSWKHDNSRDLSATMATLDKGINRLTKVLHFD
jgi:hypothetical protein